MTQEENFADDFVWETETVTQTKIHPQSLIVRACKSARQKQEEHDPLNYAAELALLMHIREHGADFPIDFYTKEWDGSNFIENSAKVSAM